MGKIYDKEFANKKRLFILFKVNAKCYLSQHRFLEFIAVEQRNICGNGALRAEQICTFSFH